MGLKLERPHERETSTTPDKRGNSTEDECQAVVLEIAAEGNGLVTVLY